MDLQANQDVPHGIAQKNIGPVVDEVARLMASSGRSK